MSTMKATAIENNKFPLSIVRILKVIESVFMMLDIKRKYYYTISQPM